MYCITLNDLIQSNLKLRKDKNKIKLNCFSNDLIVLVLSTT